MADKFYITTSIPYVNSVPHVGHALEVVQADAIARYRRILGEDVRFLTGADEHGAKIARAAQTAGKDPKAFVDANAARFKELLKALSISNDDFIQTSDQKRHWPGAQALWQKIHAAGDISKASYKGLYCVGHEAFVTDKDLVNGICEDHGKPPEVVEEENYFFKLSRYTTDIKKIIESGELQIIPDARKNEMLTFLDAGLDDVSFSRPAKDIPWGVPVPGDESQNMYVWCDALSNYVSALVYGSADEALFKTYWPADMHLIGKDILRFHSLIWIGMLLSAKLPIPKRILVHGFIISGDKKMSKSLGNVVDPFEMIERYGADALRYFFLREISTFEDGDMTKERFEKAYNANLANGLGNLVSRTAKMIESYFEGRIQKPAEEVLLSVPLQASIALFDGAQQNLSVKSTSLRYFVQEVVEPQYTQAMDSFRLNEALGILWHLISVMDAYIQEYEPFKLVHVDKTKTQAILWQLAQASARLGLLLSPFMPDTAAKVLATFGADKVVSLEDATEFEVKKGEGLFPRIS